MARRNIDNVMSEWLIACGVAVAVIIALATVAHQQHDIWEDTQHNLEVQQNEIQVR
jgi:hypothetical protein